MVDIPQMAQQFDDTISWKEIYDRLQEVFPWFTDRLEVTPHTTRIITAVGANNVQLRDVKVVNRAYEFRTAWYKFDDCVMLKVAGDEALNTIVISGSKRA